MIERKSKLVFKKIKSISRISLPNIKKVYNLKCSPYTNFFSNSVLVHNCDTEVAFVNRPYCNVEEIKGKSFIRVRNPLTPKKAFIIIKRLNDARGPYHSVSFTGGEPLLQNNFLKEILPLIRQMGIKIYLETNGILFKELSEIIDYIDIIALDFKLPSSTGLKDFWYEHNRFLEVASRKDFFVKVVICNSTKLDDLKKAVNLLTIFNKDIPFVLQPNSFEMGRRLMNKIAYFQRFCLNNLSNVRIIPQMQKIIGIK